ncbi:PTS sorbitol transporter subunit IIA [Micrococcales bacterium 31B]|nr:PTS sorbitol transporter subunit IIA [Micrococcales bacterium 31B]
MYWNSTITTIGTDASMMFDAGVYILFGEPVPDVLAEIAIVHRGEPATAAPRVGDTFTLGDSQVVFDEVGELAEKNLNELGHVVIYVNQPEQNLLPGAIKATGTLKVPAVGDQMSLRSAS